MRNVKESEIEKLLVQKVKSLGGACLKFFPDNCVGMPDRLILLPDGITVWAELKRPKGGRLSPIQKYRHQYLESLGQRVVLLWSKEDVEEFIHSVL